MGKPYIHLFDTTLRDGHQCLWATRMTTAMMEPVIETLDGIGFEAMDREGRWLQADFGNLSVVSLYFPSGSSSELRQDVKFACMDWIKPRLAEWVASGREWVICGDWNIAHRKIDLKNWRGNQKNSGFLPE